MSECPAGCCPHEGAGTGDACPGDLPHAPLRERVAHLRCCRLLPAAKIAALTRADRQTISQLLYEIADEASLGLVGWRSARPSARDEWLEQFMAGGPGQPRPAGPPSARGPSQVELLAALRADPQVRRVLERHGIAPATPAGRAGGRVPGGQQLTADLVSDLYEGCGLGLSHIGLLTGRPSSAVGVVLRAKGIRLRPARQTSPFLRRFRLREA